MRLLKVAGALMVVALGLLFVRPPTAHAEDCGNQCKSCSIAGYEGTQWNASGIYNMTCYSFIPYCVACVIERTNDGDDAEALLAALRTQDDASIPSIVRRNRGRLLVSPSRHLVVLRGTDCDPNALASVVYVGDARMRTLQEMGLPLLSEYLADSQDR